MRGTASEPASASASGRLPIRGADRRPARVRPYSLTGGRTRFTQVLHVETFVAALDTRASQPHIPADGEQGDRIPGDRVVGDRVADDRMPEMPAIVEVCRRMRTIAEISALLKLPLGVVRVLVSDLADQGRIRVYGTGHGPGRPERALLERVLSGLRSL
ncbi:multi-component regulatory system-8 [Streptomyces sp. NRRL S-444]|nr:multi-component regulatory system-8 [Streptomyces sp. NRRL S-444]